MTAKTIIDGGISGVLADGNAVVVPMRGALLPLTVWVNPAAGDTVRVEHRVSPDAPWTAWDAGDVGVYTESVRTGPLYELRFTRTAGAGTTSAYGVA